MVKQPRTIRQSELLNQLVLDRNTMEELGQIEVVWMYPQIHRVLGFVCHSGFLGRQKSAFKLKQITALEENSVLVTEKPTETDAERVRQLESLVHCEVWSDQGNRVGQIIDFVFDLETGEIHNYLLVASRLAALTDGVYQLPPRKIISLGRKRVLIAEATIARLDVYQGGIKQTLSKAGEWLKGDLEQVVEDWRSWRQAAQAKTRQVGGKLQGWISQVTRSTQDWTQQTLEQAKHAGQTWAEQVKESRQTWQARLNDEFMINLTAAEQAAAKARANLLDEDDFDFEVGLEEVPQGIRGKATTAPVTFSWADSEVAVQDVVGDRGHGEASAEDEWDWDEDDLWKMEPTHDREIPHQPLEAPVVPTTTATPPTEATSTPHDDPDEWDWDDI
ncbi:PRC-barrel domain-containing protein [Trichothermofontia sp.]